MFVRFSPVKKQNKVAPAIKEEIEELSLAQFSRIPKLAFEMVEVGNTSTQKLVIRNPTLSNIKLHLLHDISSEMQVQFSWEQIVIETESEETLQITWTPTKEIAYRTTLILKDYNSIRKAIPIVFKSVVKKSKKSKSKKTSRKSPKKSPTKKYYPSPPSMILTYRKICSPKQNLIPKIKISSNTTVESTKSIYGKENKMPAFPFDFSVINERRETYVLKEKPYFDSLENIGAAISPIQQIQQSSPFHSNKEEDPLDLSLATYLKMNISNCDDMTPNKNCGSSSFFTSSTGKCPVQTTNIISTIPCSTLEYVYDETGKTPTGEKYDLKSKSTLTGSMSNGSIVRVAKATVDGRENLSTLTRSSSDTSLATIATYIIDENERTYNFDCVEPDSTRATYTISHGDIADLNSLGWSKNLNCIEEIPHTNEQNITGAIKGWSKSGGQAYRIAKRTSGLEIRKNLQNFQAEVPILISRKCDTTQLVIQNPFLLAATNLVDPFMTPALEIDTEWISKQEMHFKNWLNRILCPPLEFIEMENETVDVAKIWRECTKNNINTVTVTESVKIESKHLQKLREATKKIFCSPEVTKVLDKLKASINSGRISIRDDKDVHFNVGIKKDFVELLLNYNPLWLRIGMETIFSLKIPLKSNRDFIGLSNFIIEQFLNCKKLVKLHKSAHAPSYKADLKKHVLFNFFALVYILDQAKNKKVIPHDPCLFSRKATVKDSREIILCLSRDLISSVGDITKVLKSYGYIVTHIQTYINEFDYRIENLGVDLRDGVRLTRVAEIILKRKDLTDQLRVPAISRLQKVHNTKIVLSALNHAGYEILYDISPKDIADGHKEKTLSFLWQIIKKFEAPLMLKKATIIQRWFRSLPVVLKRRSINREKLRREKAATVIQQWFRRQKLSEKIFLFSDILRMYLKMQCRIRAVIKIQSYFRMHKSRKNFTKLIKVMRSLQARCRGWIARNQHVKQMHMIKTIFEDIELLRKQSMEFFELREAVINVQRRFRANRLCKTELTKFTKIKVATIKIQHWYKSILAMRLERSRFLKIKSSCISIQQKWRAIKTMRKNKEYYMKLKWATLCIQRRVRANKSMKIEQRNYQQMRTACIVIQRRYRAVQIMTKTKHYFEKLKASAVFIQRRFRANKLCKIQRKKYAKMRATVKIQLWYKSILAMRVDRIRFLKIRSSCINIQQMWRATKSMREKKEDYMKLRWATVCIQRRFRANKLMQMEQRNYQQMRIACIVIQRWYRAVQIMTKTKHYFEKLKAAAGFVQRRFRANKLCRIERMKYVELRATIRIQQWYKSILAMRIERSRFLKIKSSCIRIQQKWRATKTMRENKEYYMKLKWATLCIQRRFRANKLMKIEQSNYQQTRTSCIVIQRRYRALQIMTKTKHYFEQLKASAVFVQRRFRANKLCKIHRKKYAEMRATIKIQLWYKSVIAMRAERNRFLKIKSSCINIQQMWRAARSMREKKEDYMKLRWATVSIQRRFRANKLMQMEQRNYQQVRASCIVIQRRYRAVQIMNKIKQYYETLKAAVVFVQRRFRANRLGRVERKKFTEIKRATIRIQKWYRSILVMRVERSLYFELRNASIKIQQRWRATMLMSQNKKYYIKLREATIFIQRKYRTIQIMKKNKRYFDKLKAAVLFVQRRFRANKLCLLERKRYTELRATMKIQRWYKSILTMRVDRDRFLEIKSVCISIQHRWRAVKVMREHKEYYLKLKKATVYIQTRFRANRCMKIEKHKYVQLRIASVTIQRRLRSYILMKIQRKKFVKIRTCAIKIQNWFRATIAMKECRKNYLQLKHAVMVIENRYKANKLMNLERKYYEDLKKTTRMVEHKYRAKLLGRQIRKSYLELRAAVIFVQKTLKQNGFFSIEARTTRERIKNEEEAAIKIQKIWRGYRTRSLTNSLCADIRENIKLACENVSPTKTLAVRGNAAVQLVLNGNCTFLVIISALKDIAFITRNSGKTCEEYSQILPYHLYLLLGVVGRSLPDMAVNIHCLDILINFYKYQPSRVYSFCESGIDNIISVMMHFCDKESPIFPTACTLLWLFAHEPQWKKKILRNNLDQRMHKIDTLLQRKVTMVSNMRRKGNSIFLKSEKVYLPGLLPDWGLDLQKKPYKFNNGPFAFKSLKKILGIGNL